MGRVLRIAAVLVGVSLIWPGAWALIAISNNYSIRRVDPLPLFDRVGMWVTAGAIWGTSFFLIRFGAKKEKPRQTTP
jgi:hypothetical protein